MAEEKHWWERSMFWLPALAILISFSSASLAYRSTTIAEKARQISADTKATAERPKLIFTDLKLKKAKSGAARLEIAAVSFHIENRGILRLRDVVTSATYTDTTNAPVTQAGMERVTIAPSDYATGSLLLFQGEKDVLNAPSYDKVISGTGALTIFLRAAATDENNVRTFICEHFFYNWVTETFDRKPDCKAYDLRVELGTQ